MVKIDMYILQEKNEQAGRSEREEGKERKKRNEMEELALSSQKKSHKEISKFRFYYHNHAPR